MSLLLLLRRFLVGLPELLQLLLADRLDILHCEQQADPQFELDLSLGRLEAVFPNGGDVEVVGEYSCDQLFCVFF
jgi:hypothetical protein